MEHKDFNILLDLMRETKKDVEGIRSGSHEIRDELHKVTGLFQLLRQDLAIQKEDNKEKFNVIHERIEKERVEARTRQAALEKTINEIAPKVTHMSNIFDWATRIIVTTLIGGIMWATVQYMGNK